MTARRTLARRVLASFVVVVIAFAATVFAGLYAQRRAAQDVELLSFGYAPLEVSLARLRATQWAVVERMPTLGKSGVDAPTRLWIETFVRGRFVVLAEARSATRDQLARASDESMAAFGRDVDRELDEVERKLSDSAKGWTELLGAFGGADEAKTATLLVRGRDNEAAVATRLDALAVRIEAQRKALVTASAARDRRSMALSVGLALLSLVVAAVATREVRRRLAPLETLTGRAQAIAAGDRSPLPRNLVEGPRDEIRDLAVAFGAMVEGVATRDADLLRLRRRQEDIVNHLRAAVVALRADGTIEAANPAARTLLGAGEGDTLGSANHALWELVRSDVAHAIERGVEPAARAGVTLPEGRVLDVRVVAMTGGEGRLALLVADDVSEAAAARARALQAERLAAIGKMAAHITHEIRNPLSSIQLNVELLEETLRADGASGEARRLLSAIVREVGRLADVSEEYLRVARLPSPRPAEIDLAELVRDVAVFAGPELERARVSVDLRVPEHPVIVAIDEAQIRQALVNLVRNAREAMEDGGRLTLTVSSRDDAVVLDVVDEGPGIPEEVRMRIFDPFFTTKATGTGLGLPLTRQIVEAHGGAIACEAAEPRGTRFRLSFPRRKARERSDARGASEGVVEPAPR